MRNDLLTRLRGMTQDELYIELYTDSLTRVLNRRAFELAHSTFVAIIDLDSLKYINDTLGHRAGDLQLQVLADALVNSFGCDDVYRLSGDEFVVRGDHAVMLHSKLTQLRQWLPGFSFGLGTCLVKADRRLRADKQLREESGQRAARGEQPWWLPFIGPALERSSGL